MEIHSRLQRIINDHLAFKLELPGGSKGLAPDPKNMVQYGGGNDDNEFKSWLMNIVITLQVKQLGGDEQDNTCIAVVMFWLKDKALEWYHAYVMSLWRSKEHWTFREIILELYDRFIHDAAVNKARTKFDECRFSDRGTTQGYYNMLQKYADEMIEPPDAYSMKSKFMRGIPGRIATDIFNNGLTVKGSTIKELVVAARKSEWKNFSISQYVRSVGTSSKPEKRRDTPLTANNKPCKFIHKTIMRPIGF